MESIDQIETFLLTASKLEKNIVATVSKLY